MVRRYMPDILLKTPINQSINQSINQLINQSINQSFSSPLLFFSCIHEFRFISMMIWNISMAVRISEIDQL